jgi:hypothetical protein
MAIITLTTDFGTRDGYVGAVKGVLARFAPEARVIDIAHDVPPGDIAHAAWVVDTACWRFPRETVHLIVVDPGVGGRRNAVITSARLHWFVGPDNGVFHYTQARAGWTIDPVRVAMRLSLASLRVSATFHGRDLFAPAAAALSLGHPVDTLGEPTKLVGALPWGERSTGEGRVIHIDHFGNLITDLPPNEAGEAIAIAGHRLPIVRTYEDVAPGQLLAYIGSSRTVEVAVRGGRADKAIDAPRGTPVMPVSGVEPYR